MKQSTVLLLLLLISSCSALMAAHCARAPLPLMRSVSGVVGQPKSRANKRTSVNETRMQRSHLGINPRDADTGAGAGAGMLRALTHSLPPGGWGGGRAAARTQIEPLLLLLLQLTPSTKSHKTKLIIVRQACNFGLVFIKASDDAYARQGCTERIEL